MRKHQQPWDKLTMSELSQVMHYSTGYVSLFQKKTNPFKIGTPLYKIWNKAKGEVKKF
jgi:hypothetical protein